MVYNGLVCIIGMSGQLGYIDMNAGVVKTPYEPKGMFQFSARLPGDEYRDQSQQVVHNLWPLVRGIEFAVPKEADEAPHDSIGHILFTRDGQFVASGYRAAREFGLKIDEKRFLVAGHHYSG